MFTGIVTDVGEVAIYSEFGFEGAVISSNTVDGAALGIVACNFNEGGRLAVVQGNLIRNLKPKRPAGTDPGDGAGIGISIEAVNHGYHVVIPRDCVAGYPAEYGEAVLKNTLSRLAHFTTSDELVAVWR